MRAAMRDLHVPGLSLAVVREGKVVKARGYGLASLELNRPVTEDTVFEIGSMTKQFTAAALLMLVEDGRVALDAPLSKYLPNTPPAWDGITVRHLLTHSSGIPDYLGVEGLPDLSRRGLTHREIATVFFEKLSLEFTPGATWAYSNTGYLLLGNVIEAVSGQAYFDFLKERIFGPLGMRATRASTPTDVIPHRASGYEWRNGAFENRPALTENAYAAGSIVSTVRDIAKWDAALSEGRLLTEASRRAMWTAHPVALGVPPFDYGFGWFLDTVHGSSVILHSGGTPGFSSVIHRFVEQHISVILLTNRGDRPLDHVARDVAALYVPALAATSPRDPDAALTGRLRGILARLFAGEADPDDFTPAMRAFLGTPLGRDVWKWAAEDGPLASFTRLEEEWSGDLHIVRYRVKLGQATLRFSFTVDGQGRVARVTWW